MILLTCSKHKNKNKNDITTIITTCCRKSAPDASIILENIRNLKKYSPKMIKNLIIVFDGGLIKSNTNLHDKCKNDCNIKNYKIYIENIKKEVKNILPNSNVKFIEMDKRSCLTNSLKAGIDNSETKFINIVQDDLILVKKIDFEKIKDIINKNEDIQIIRYNRDLNSYHQKYTKKICPNKKFSKEFTIEINGIKLSKSNQYCDNNHITTKEFYYNYIFPNVKKYNFMEHSLICEVGNLIPDKIWHLGNYNDGNYLNNKDGRNN